MLWGDRGVFVQFGYIRRNALVLIQRVIVVVIVVVSYLHYLFDSNF